MIEIELEDYIVKHQTDEAVLFYHALDDHEMWIPKSVLGAIDYNRGWSHEIRISEDVYGVEVEEWFAEKEDLE